MNIYFGIFFAILIAAACAASGYEGHKIGVEHQQAVDQKQFDAYNQQIASQKAQAAAILADANAANLKLAMDRDLLKTRLERERGAAQKITEGLRTELAGVKLRFIPDQGAGCGDSGSGTASAGANPASPAAPGVMELPAEISRNLLELAFKADQLKDNYATCYAYVQQVK